MSKTSPTKRPLRPSLNPTTSTTNPTSTSTSTTTPRGPPPPSSLHLDPTTHISDKAHLSGPFAIHISADTVIHPHARITAATSDIVIEAGVIVWERCLVGVAPSDTSADITLTDPTTTSPTVPTTRTTILGAYSTLHPGSVVGAGARVGEGASIGVGAVVGTLAELGDWSSVAPMVVVGEGEVVEKDACVVEVGGGVRVVRSPVMAATPGVGGRDDLGESENEAEERIKEAKREARLREVGLLRGLVKGGNRAAGTGP